MLETHRRLLNAVDTIFDSICAFRSPTTEDIERFGRLLAAPRTIRAIPGMMDKIRREEIGGSHKEIPLTRHSGEHHATPLAPEPSATENVTEATQMLAGGPICSTGAADTDGAEDSVASTLQRSTQPKSQQDEYQSILPCQRKPQTESGLRSVQVRVESGFTPANQLDMEVFGWGSVKSRPQEQ